MSYETIRYEVEGAIARITLDRPDKLNAYTTTMMSEIVDALDRVDADDAVRAVIVTGEGRAFCAGADMSGGNLRKAGGAPDDDSPSGVVRDSGGLLTLRIFNCLKPVIAAINGPAVGIGVTMTLAMDVRLASETARFGFVFARRGIVPEAASSWFLPRVVGISKALQWCYSGRVFGAEEAHAAGLVDAVLPPDELLPAAEAWAREIAENSAPISVALTRQMLWRGLGLSHPMEAHRIDSRAISARGRSADSAEGVRAFLDKRSAAFPEQVSRDMPDFFPWWEEPEFR